MLEGVLNTLALRLYLITSLRKARRDRTLIAYILINTMQDPRTLKNNIYHSNKRGPPLFPVLGQVLIHSFDKTHVLVVTVKLIWLLFLNILSFNFVPTLNKSLLDWQDLKEAMYTALLSF